MPRIFLKYFLSKFIIFFLNFLKFLKFFLFFRKLLKAFEILPTSSEFEQNDLNLFPSSKISNLTPDPLSLFTKSIRDFCKVSSITKKFNCKNFKFLSSSKISPGNFLDYLNFFKPQSTKFALKMLKNSNFFHMWNEGNGTERARVKVESAFVKIAKRKCPKVFESAVGVI